MKKLVEIYSVVEYLENRAIDVTLYENRESGVHHIKLFNKEKESPFDVCGMDKLSIIPDKDNLDENGEITYDVKWNRCFLKTNEI